ncbi:sporulation protein [Phytomonospora endophytica]|uniref:Sporulation-control protein n=1 Tax=Phytomonospora endophytica TaxID=714109 RepID=A0A841FPX0_9ACTN|nr:sporulation protein [Phytomonospora endophytica]MBB6036883.1 sporulation-control protein [Phytomonospora endophytica]GIG68083.1 sporulation protein [Phytomonospora endophytica]
MVFEKLPRAFGVGGPGVNTVLDRARMRPGDQVTGQVHLDGGDIDADVEPIALSLITWAEGGEVVEFHRADVCGPFRLAAGERRSIAFTFGVPWEAPLSGADGPLVGVRAGEGDIDPLHVAPLPSQERVLDAFTRLGFTRAKAALEHGRVGGQHQELPFFAELGFRPPPGHTGAAGEVGLAFVADRHHLAVVLAADGRRGAAGDFGRWIFPHETAIRTDWEGLVTDWLDELPERFPRTLSGGPVPAGG